jgi:hypothetical protein
MWFPQDLQVTPDPPSDDAELTVTPQWAVADWILMSASCDVDRAVTIYPHAILGRVLPATFQTFNANNQKEFDERAEVIRKGLEPTSFLLAGHPDALPPFPLSFVHYRTHFTMPTDYLRRKSDTRLRLKHPFREAFGAWAASNMGRVGPETAALIPEFTKTFPKHTLRANLE